MASLDSAYEPRGLNRPVVLSLGTGGWIGAHENLIVSGPTGIGKSFLVCALVGVACRRGFAATYIRLPRLLHNLAVSRGDGTYTRLLTTLGKLDLLAIDGWLLASLKDAERRDVLEVIEDRTERPNSRRRSVARHRDRRGRRSAPSTDGPLFRGPS